MSFTYKASITVDHTKVSGTGDLSNFTFPIVGTYDGTGTEPDLRSTGNGGNITSTSGYDIGFYSDSGLTTALNYERKVHDVSTGKILYWVKVPSLSGSNNTVIYMGYGDNSITTDQQTITDTWDSSYKGVWHLDAAGNATQKDSTTTNYDLSPVNLTSSDSTTGILDKGIHFNKTANKYLQKTTATNFTIAGQFTFSCWAKFDDESNDSALMAHWGANHRGPMLFVFNNAIFMYVLGGWYGDANGNGITGYNDGNWHYIAFTFDTDYHLFHNGSTIDAGYPYATDMTTGTFHVGAYMDARAVNAIIAEPRFALTGRSSDWLTTEYNSQGSPSTFYAMGDETAITSSFVPKIIII